jgi:hypothetical protein
LQHIHLDSDAGAPVGGWFEQVGDFYPPIVTAETPDSFQTVLVFQTLKSPLPENFSRLVRFDWPSGEITELKRVQDLRVWQVECKFER